MTDEELRVNLDAPDNTLATRGMEISGMTKPRSIAIVMHRRGDPSPETYAGFGSGVLVQIMHRYFILTAGHCVKSIVDNRYTVTLPLAAYSTVFRPNIVRSNHGCVQSCDWGYLEIARQDVVAMESRGCTFMNLDRIHAIERDDASLRTDDFTLAGYVRELSIVDDDGVRVRFAHFSTKTTEFAKAPDSPAPPIHEGIHAFDLVLSSEEAIDNMAEPHGKSYVPRLGGASGGGCWKANLHPHPEWWDSTRYRLAGTHSGTLSDKKVINGKTFYFARQASVGHHLSLIASDYSDVSVEITERWPHISRFRPH